MLHTKILESLDTRFEPYSKYPNIFCYIFEELLFNDTDCQVLMSYLVLAFIALTKQHAFGYISSS